MFYHMARTGRMNRILYCDWLPELARWSYRARSGLLLVSRKKNFTESEIIPLFAKLVRSRWLDIGLETDSKSINRQKKELGQYPAILTSHLVNNPISEAYHLEELRSNAGVFQRTNQNLLPNIVCCTQVRHDIVVSFSFGLNSLSSQSLLKFREKNRLPAV